MENLTKVVNALGDVNTGVMAKTDKFEKIMETTLSRIVAMEKKIDTEAIERVVMPSIKWFLNHRICSGTLRIWSVNISSTNIRMRSFPDSRNI